MAWFDCGVNLTSSRFAGDVEQVIARAQAADVNRLLVIGTNLEQSRAAVQLCEQFPRQLVATVGIHPHDAAEVPIDYLSQLAELAGHPAVVAIGECGLDFNRNFSPPDAQRRVFQAQLDLAAEVGKPVYLHERDALTDQLAILKNYQNTIPNMLAHCFTGGREALAAYLDLGCYIGVTGWVCDERRGQELRTAVPLIPADRLVLETDAPFLIPRTLKPRPAMNEPCWLPEIAEVVANLRQQSISDLAAESWQVSHNLFGRPVRGRP
ncbi:TatD family hydrolase [Pseudidiomarina sp.]|uniref:TatD family hydrolase n=1 Tax=Pseudidiomarina sp. TaxID=2081707 RepID=UPI00299F4032|nr:TatD family hydrolase [Pseudidiomarina sp.]MDX1705397.1 TatD family hydrolase [Pseudidiomarina sp.]